MFLGTSSLLGTLALFLGLSSLGCHFKLAQAKVVQAKVVQTSLAQVSLAERAEMVPHQRERHDYANCAPCVMIGCLAC